MKIIQQKLMHYEQHQHAFSPAFYTSYMSKLYSHVNEFFK